MPYVGIALVIAASVGLHFLGVDRITTFIMVAVAGAAIYGLIILKMRREMDREAKEKTGQKP